MRGLEDQVALAQRTNRMAEDNSKIAFCLPFISDEMSKAVRASLRKADLEDHVRVVEIPPANLKTQLVRNRLYDRLCITPNCVICPFGKEGDCMVSGVVYLITCQACGDQYIGETGRPLCIRVKEHLDGMTRSRISTPLGVHRRHSHGNCSFAICEIALCGDRHLDKVKNETPDERGDELRLAVIHGDVTYLFHDHFLITYHFLISYIVGSF
ncbi:hypothetical protein Y032_0107g3832 [Ancylostoma ceylanicum]|nr:hypothetical protein Y032_0107g3832 [Ancylostoma ceylanicum]